MALQHLRSGVAHKRPIPTLMSAGQIALNTNQASPGVFIKDSNGDLVKVGPVHIGNSAPNSSPASTAADSLVTGATYQILTVGTSDFTSVGASANTVGVVFTATGTTTGTGTVSGQQGVQLGEMWLDTSTTPNEFKVYDGNNWKSAIAEGIPVARLAYGSARQLLQTNAAGNGVEWTDNVSVPGSLNVTAGASFGAAVTVTGITTLSNDIRNADGTAGSPSITFSSDQDTGFYRIGADSIGVATGGYKRITISSNGGENATVTTTLHGEDAYATVFQTTDSSGNPIVQLGNGANFDYITLNTGVTDAVDGTIRVDNNGSIRIRGNDETKGGSLRIGVKNEASCLAFEGSRTGNSGWDAGRIDVFSGQGSTSISWMRFGLDQQAETADTSYVWIGDYLGTDNNNVVLGTAQETDFVVGMSIHDNDIGTYQTSAPIYLGNDGTMRTSGLITTGGGVNLPAGSSTNPAIYHTSSELTSGLFFSHSEDTAYTHITAGGDILVTAKTVDGGDKCVGIFDTDPTERLVVGPRDHESAIHIKSSSTLGKNSSLYFGSSSTSNYGSIKYSEGELNRFLIFETNGTEKLRLLNDGKLGIGETVPQHELHIKSDDPTIRLQDGNGTNQYADITKSGGSLLIQNRNGDAAGPIRFRNGHDTTKEWARFTMAGRFGINTATPQKLLEIADDQPAMRLHMPDSPDAGDLIHAIEFTTVPSTTTALRAAINVYAGYTTETKDDVNIVFKAGSNDEIMTLAGDGSVGIGDSYSTSAPQSRLEVEGDAGATSRIHVKSTSNGQTTFDGSGSGLLLTAAGMNATSAYTPSIQFGSTDPDILPTGVTHKVCAAITGIAAQAYVDTDGGGMHLAFYTNPDDPGEAQEANERMRITNAGRLGIGITSPDSQLHVYHASTNMVARFESGDGTSQIGFYDNSGNARIGNTGDTLNLYSNATKGATLNGKKFGIGVTDSAFPLDVNSISGSDGSTIQQWRHDYGNGTYVTMGLLCPNNQNATDPFQFTTNNSFTYLVNSNYAMSLTSTGKVSFNRTADGTDNRIGRVENRIGSYTQNLAADGYFITAHAGDMDDNPGWAAGLTLESNSGGVPITALRGTSATTAGAQTTQKAIAIEGSGARIKFYTDSETERMRIQNSTGNVGIGLSSPAAKLEIQSDVTVAAHIKARNDANTVGLIVDGDHDATDTIIQARSNASVTPSDSDTKFIVKGPGKVGILTDAPQAYLHLNAGSSLERTAFLTKAADANFRLTTANGSGTNSAGQETARIGINYYSSDSWSEYIQFIRGSGASDGEIAIHAGDSDVMRITHEGLVGIGTTSPITELDVRTSDAFDPANAHNTSALFVKGGNTAGQGNYGGAITLSKVNSTRPGAVIAAVQTSADADQMGVGFFTHGSTTTNNQVTEKVRLDHVGRLIIRNGYAVSAGSLTGLLQVNGFTASEATASIVRTVDSNGGPSLVLCKSRGTDFNTLVLDDDVLGQIKFCGADGVDRNSVGAEIRARVDAAPGANDMPARLEFRVTANAASTPTTRATLHSTGHFSFGTTSVNPATSNVSGSCIRHTGSAYFSQENNTVQYVNRKGNDGTLISLRNEGTQEGTISVNGTTVSYNGGHLARWSQLPGNGPRTEILRGTVLSNIDEMCTWGDEDNEQLNRMQVSDIEGDRNVSGVFQAWDDDDEVYTNDFYCAMTGDFVIRIAQGTTIERGDLLMSAGDGTAKPQEDDIIRSKTIAKVTSTHVSATYSDGSYCVPCVLMAC